MLFLSRNHFSPEEPNRVLSNETKRSERIDAALLGRKVVLKVGRRIWPQEWDADTNSVITKVVFNSQVEAALASRILDPEVPIDRLANRYPIARLHGPAHSES